MKTKIYTTMLTTLIALFSINLSATPFQFTEESYIDDIPFDTEMITEKVELENIKMAYLFDEEAYVDDIPFITEEVAANSQPTSTFDIDFEEEAYIDDIPFDTKSISIYYLYTKALERDYKFSEENYIDDIPFDTEALASLKEQNNNRFVSRLMTINYVNYLF